jgi:hypothetical protein
VTIVQIRAKVPGVAGLVAASGGLLWQPTARRVEGDVVVLPVGFAASLVGGSADVEVEPSTPAWVWYVTEYFDGVPARQRAFAVPDTATVEYADLVEIDPDTLSPVPEPNPAWLAPLNLDAARDPEALFTGAITRDSNGAPTACSVLWPDGTTGAYAGTPSGTWAGAVDAYTITHGSTTYTQPMVTRNGSGQIITRPTIIIT